jgi:ParB/RepB/Spo0J family partition protein
MPHHADIKLEEIDFSDRRYIFRHGKESKGLENSLRYEGLIHSPVLLEKDRPNSNGKYIIVAGSLRLSAAKNIGLNSVFAVVYAEKEIEREDFLKIAIAENTKRENLRPVEIAEALKRIQDELDLTIDELAEDFGDTFGLGRDSEQVERYLRLNTFDNSTKDFLADAPVQDVAFDLLKVPEEKDRSALISLMREHQDLKKAQIGKIIKNAQVLSDKHPGSGFKGVFEEGAIRGILDNNELSGSKKINAFLAELEKEADPERIEKTQAFEKLMDKLDETLRKKDPELVRKVQIRKPVFGEREIKVTLTINTTRDLVDIMKELYEIKGTVIEPMLKL